MELKNQLCTLEQAKKLKELEIEQKSIWYWQELNELPNMPKMATERIEICYNINHSFSNDVVKTQQSAFSVAELGVLLGPGITVHTPPKPGENEAINRADDLIHLLDIGELDIDGCNERLARP